MNPHNAMSHPLAIHAEILALRKAKLPEKLLLAIYAAEPETMRVRRAMSMTRAGLRKLEQRLVQKGLLTIDGDRRVIRVPGLGGHFVPDSKVTKNAKKVARRASTAPKADMEPLVVPAELLGCKYLMASEKALLAYYAANPGDQNEQVVAGLGLSLSGLKNLKRGLLEKRVLVPTNDGYTIRLPGYVLMPDSMGSHFVSESEAVKNGNKVTLPAPKLTPAKDVYNYWESSIQRMGRNPSTTPDYCLSFTTKMIKRIEDESPEGPERDAALTVMKIAENDFFAKAFLDDLIKKCAAKARVWLGNATTEQLVAFRQKVEGMMLAGMPEPKLLAMVTKSIS